MLQSAFIPMLLAAVGLYALYKKGRRVSHFFCAVPKAA